MDILYVGGLSRDRFVDESLRVGGFGVVASAVLNGLVARGHAVRALTAISVRDDSSRLTGLDARIEICEYPMPSAESGAVGAGHFYNHAERIEQALPGLIAARPPHIVLVSNTAYVGCFPDVLRESAIPWATWVHTMVYPHIRYSEGPMATALSSEVHARLCTASGLIAVAQHIAAELYRMGAPQVATVPNGVDLETFSPGARQRQVDGITTDDIVVAYTAGLRPLKRLGDLVQAAAQALSVEPRLLFLLAGGGSCRDELTHQIEVAGIANRVRLVGEYARHDIARLMARADIAVLPSEAEGMSLSLLEAMASGCAVVAADIAASREVIDDGVTGLLHGVGDAAGLTRHILDLAGSAERRRSLAEAARRSVEDHHDVHQMVVRMEEVLGTFAGCTPSRAATDKRE